MKELFRLLTFRIRADELAQLPNRHLVIGMIATWIVGIGRWWDDPHAHVLKQSGIGSIAYVVALSIVLWLVVLPLRPKRWSFVKVLTFVSLTAPPALLYAIPVEMFMPMKAAAQINLWFLLIVATWRVALMLFFFRRYAGLGAGATLVCALLPLASIVIVLTVLNLSSGAVQVMGGLRNPGVNRITISVITLLGYLSFMSFVPMLIAYIVFVVLAWRSAKARKQMHSLATPPVVEDVADQDSHLDRGDAHKPRQLD